MLAFRAAQRLVEHAALTVLSPRTREAVLPARA
jgi:hypothetical protein